MAPEALGFIAWTDVEGRGRARCLATFISGAVGCQRTQSSVSLDSEQGGWYVRSMAAGSELLPVAARESAIHCVVIGLAGERCADEIIAPHPADTGYLAFGGPTRPSSEPSAI